MAISSKSVALKKCPKLLSPELFVWFNLSPIAELFFRNWRKMKPHSTVFTQQEKCRAITAMGQITAGYRIQNITQTIEFWQPTAEMNVIESFRF